MIDTLKLSKGLQKAGMTEAEADGITEALNQAQADGVTKSDLDLAKTDLKRDLDLAKRDLRNDLDLAKKDLELAIERLRGGLSRFILVSVVLVAIAQILVIKVWHGKIA